VRGQAGLEAASHYSVIDSDKQLYEWKDKAERAATSSYYGAVEDPINSGALARYSLCRPQTYYKKFVPKQGMVEELRMNPGVYDDVAVNDLLILSSRRTLGKRGQPVKDIKKIADLGFIKGLQKSTEFVLAIVEKRQKQTIQILVDAKKQVPDKPFVYFFEKLLPTVREYKTIRNCEFSPFAPLLLDPKNGTPALAEATKEADSIQELMVDFVEANAD